MTQPSTNNDKTWCRRYRPAKAGALRLVCFPHAGGSATYFLPVAVALSPEVDVVAIQYPGRQDRRAERPVNKIATLADQIHEILRHQAEVPTTFFGHSMGAVLAFEVVRRLEADGATPVRLFASGRRGPSTHRNENIHLRDDAGIIAEVRQLNGTASSLLGDDEMMRAALPALRADYGAIETYECSLDTTVMCPITVLVGDDDPKTTVDEAKVWERHTSGSFDIHVFPGGHFFLTDRADEVMQVLRRHFQAEDAHSAS